MRRCLKVFWQQVYKLKLDTQTMAVPQDTAEGQNRKGFPFSMINIFDNAVTGGY